MGDRNGHVYSKAQILSMKSGWTHSQQDAQKLCRILPACAWSLKSWAQTLCGLKGNESMVDSVTIDNSLK